MIRSVIMNMKISKKNMRTMDDYDDYDEDYTDNIPEYCSDEMLPEIANGDEDDYVSMMKNPLNDRRSKYIEVKEIEYKYTSLEYRLKMEQYFEYEEYYKELYPDYWGEFEKKYQDPLTPLETPEKILDDGIVVPCFSPSFLKKSFGERNLSYQRKRYSEKNIGARHNIATVKKNKNTGGARVMTEEEKIRAKEKIQIQMEKEHEKKLLYEKKNLETERIKLEQLKKKDEKFNEYIKNIDKIKENPECSGEEGQDTKEEDEESEEDYLSLVKTKIVDKDICYNIKKETTEQKDQKKEQKPKAVKSIENEILKSMFSQEKNVKETFSKTTMCKFGKSCVRIKTCNYAHSESELVVRKCIYDPKCVNPDCKFFHIGDKVKKQNILPSAVNEEKEMCKNGSNCKYGSKCKFKHRLFKTSFEQPIRIEENFGFTKSYAEMAKSEPKIKIERPKEEERRPLLILKPKSVEEMKIPGTWVKILNICDTSQPSVSVNITQNIEINIDTSFQTKTSSKKNRYKKVNKEEKEYEKLTKTKLCLSVENNTECPHGTKCRYAHNIFEIVARPCRNGADCNYNGCRFAH